MKSNIQCQSNIVETRKILLNKKNNYALDYGRGCKALKSSSLRADLHRVPVKLVIELVEIYGFIIVEEFLGNLVLLTDFS